MVKGRQPATDIWAGGLRSGGHYFLALVSGNYSGISDLLMAVNSVEELAIYLGSRHGHNTVSFRFNRERYSYGIHHKRSHIKCLTTPMKLLPRWSFAWQPGIACGPLGRGLGRESYGAKLNTWTRKVGRFSNLSSKMTKN